MTTIERIQAALPSVVLESMTAADGTPTIRVSRDDVRRVIVALKEQCGFETNTFITAVDHYPREPRFDMAWQFLSYQHNERVRIHARVDAPNPSFWSIVDLFPGAGYSERECFDMFGIQFEGHTGLKRLL